MQANRYLILKTALLYFLPLFFLVGLVLYRLHAMEIEKERTLYEAEGKLHLDLLLGEISQVLQEIASDLKVLNAHHELESALETDDPAGLDPLTQEFVAFSNVKLIYDQIRLIDRSGMERIRVNRVDGHVRVVPLEELQNKSHRYYFNDILRLEKGEFYLSLFDLNIERRRIERPLKPTFRAGKSIFDRNGRKGGILILDYLGRHLLGHLLEHRLKGSEAYLLLGSDDLWLRSAADDEAGWRFVYRGEEEPAFQERFPGVWKRVLKTKSGQFFSPDGFVTYRTVDPYLHLLQGKRNQFFNSLDGQNASGLKPFSWKLVSIVPTETVYANSNETLKTYLAAFAFISAGWGLASFIIAQSKVRRGEAEQMRVRAEIEREVLLAELGKRNAELEGKNAELERFAYTVSHDLKSPLITIKGFLGLLEKDIASGEDARIQSDIDRISNAAEKMKRLLEELLELSRVGRLVNPSEKIQLIELVREAVEMVKGRLREREVNLEYVKSSKIYWIMR